MRLVSKGMFGLVALSLIAGGVGCATQGQPDQARNIVRKETAPINYRGDTTIDRRNTMDRRTNDLTNVRTDRTQAGQAMRVADDVADSVAELKMIDSATVMVTDRTAYVAVMFERDYQGGVSDRVKEQVTRRVRQVDPSINRVYVSANPDFFRRMGDYARDVRDGRPISGIMDQFREMVQRTFPDVK